MSKEAMPGATIVNTTGWESKGGGYSLLVIPAKAGIS
jgi:hypothetical protein